MIDRIDRPERFSPYGGKLILETVPGDTNGKLNPENDVETSLGTDREMYSYIPASGVYHAKQAQVLMVLRNDASEASAEKLLRELGLDTLAEEKHCIVLFPNPSDPGRRNKAEDEIKGELGFKNKAGDEIKAKIGWQYQTEEEIKAEIGFLVRCFAYLPKSKGHVAGFNGMIFYLATDPESSAIAASVASLSPLDAAGIVVGKFPADFTLPKGEDAPEDAFLYERNEELEARLARVNGPCEESEEKDGFSLYVNKENPGIRYIVSDAGLSKETVRFVWDELLSDIRRWRNDTYGIYQKRPDLTAYGVTGHVLTDELSIPGDEKFSVKRTWYEYIPEKVKASQEPVPLVFYFHGINCTPLYGAEQSDWCAIAEKEGFIVVFPAPAIEERWNGAMDDRQPDDAAFILKLIEYENALHPIDRTRIYLSGFSMGSMFTNALASAYPDIFVGGIALSGPHVGYLYTLDQSKPGLLLMRPNSILRDLPPRDEAASPQHILADKKKAEKDYRVPMIQFAGVEDKLLGFEKGQHWPLNANEQNDWTKTITYWLHYNAIDGPKFTDTPTGLLASESFYEEERFFHQIFKDSTGEPMYHFITVARMAHAVDPREIRIGWELLRHFRREKDGTLTKVV